MATSMLGSGALADVAGPLKDFAEKLGGSKGPMWLSAFKLFLRQENPWTLKLIQRAAIRIGGVAKDDLVKQLEDGGHSVSSWARDIMSKPAFATLKRPTTVELGWIAVRDLGFIEEPTTMELFARIKEVGDLCPAEVGPHLRLADNDQERGTWYWVVMEPVSDSDGPRVFPVGRHADGGRWLRAFYAYPENCWPLAHTVVFVLRPPQGVASK